MCGIVGLFLKDKSLEPQLGSMLSEMLISLSDRGPDSAGIAIYGAPSGNEAKITIQSAAPERDFRARLEDHHIVTVERGPHLPHTLKIDQGGTMHAHEARWIELRFERAQPLTLQMRLLAEMEPHVVPVRLRPVELRGLAENDLAGRGADGKALEMLRTFAQ